MTDQSFDALGVAGALNRSYSSDQKGFLPYIVQMFEAAIPENVNIVRKPVRMFSRETRIEMMEVNLGDWTYRLLDPGAGKPLQSSRTKTVRGISLKTETVPMPEWLEGIVSAIGTSAVASEKAFFALKGFMDSAG